MKYRCTKLFFPKIKRDFVACDLFADTSSIIYFRNDIICANCLGKKIFNEMNIDCKKEIIFMLCHYNSYCHLIFVSMISIETDYIFAIIYNIIIYIIQYNYIYYIKLYLLQKGLTICLILYRELAIFNAGIEICKYKVRKAMRMWYYRVVLHVLFQSAIWRRIFNAVTRLPAFRCRGNATEG